MADLEWAGKNAVAGCYNRLPFKLIECDENSENIKSRNLLIYGDNLIGLKSLLPIYQNGIKCIYIDPPYNTGNNDWAYNDNMDNPIINQWINETIVNDERMEQSYYKTVSRDDLNRHDKWLCMMYPRLELLQKLLCEDGIIFISIDDNEQANLKIILDEIFGQRNFIAKLIWLPKSVTDNQLEIKIEHEYVYVYCKNIDKKSEAISNVISPNISKSSSIFNETIENSVVKNGKGNPASEITLPVGFPAEINKMILDKIELTDEFYDELKKTKWISQDQKKKYKIKKFPIAKDKIIVKNKKLTRTVRMLTGWQNLNKLKKFINNNCKPLEDNNNMEFFLTKNGDIKYKKERKKGEARLISSIISDVGNTTSAKSELKKLGIDFDYPKPVELVKFLIKVGSKDGDIILDSFAGSGTTGQAVIELNNDCNGNRKFILIEIDEKIAKDKIKKRLEKLNEYNETGFSYCKVGNTIFDEYGLISKECTINDLAKYIYFLEEKKPLEAMRN
ncbi:MAG: site-specific DNA-methyltransferase [Nitrosopumilus sp.]|nr:site-specific DNA-methyltransferase [Nitrosopumilus sp.]